ncbi:hypothetical protein Pam3_26 [Pseudanabaena phage Pam3]|nr:hypothetical protein Pam3_26 [Pseudanabaena phage Pam3]
MRLLIGILFALLSANQVRAFDCPLTQMVNIRSAVNNVPGGSIPTSFDYMGPYGSSQTTWNFPITVPTGSVLLITDIFFQDKKIITPGNQGGYRPNYAVLFGIDTLTSVIPSRHYRTPIKMPAGSVISGAFINHSSEQQNMIIGVNGCLVNY